VAQRDNAACDENGRRVAHSVRLEVPHESLQLLIVSVERNLKVDANFRNELLGRETRARYLIEPHGEFRHAVAANRDSGGGAVSAKSREQVAALCES